MSKIINVGGTKMLLDDDGNLHPIPKNYYDINESHSNNLAFKRPKKEYKVSKVGELYTALNDKSGGKCNKVTRIVMNEFTMNYLSEHTKIREEVYNLYGLHTVEHVLDMRMSDNVIYIHYADMRYIVISVGKELKRKDHYVEKILRGENNEV